MIESLHENKEDDTCGISSAISYCVDDEVFEEDFGRLGSSLYVRHIGMMGVCGQWDIFFDSGNQCGSDKKLH